MKRHSAETVCGPRRRAGGGWNALLAVAALAALGALFPGCPSEKKRGAEPARPEAEASCVIKGFYLGMPIREAVERVNARYPEAFGPPRYKTDHEETKQWMESLPVKPVEVTEPAPRFKEYRYDRFHVVRYRDDGREYMFPFSPFLTDDEGRVTSIFLTGPIARRIFDSEAMDPEAYLNLLSRELNVPAWEKVVAESGYHWWTAAVPGKCKVEVYRDKGVKVLPAP